MTFKKKIDATKKVILDLPQFDEGDELEIVINSLIKTKKKKRNFLILNNGLINGKPILVKVFNQMMLNHSLVGDFNRSA
ncbi:hypothetical protein H8E88_35380 [candidate division KSB1 bacterium]|nr:hypothetical protein [candidate division KSB1 bacterium]MBL7093128.1 hypothetical protein [candidate division KSB1 bacterium]